MSAALLALALLGGCGSVAVEQSIARMHKHADAIGLTEKSLAVGEATVSYRIGGEGPPLMLIHGFGGDGVSTWLPQLEALAAQRTLIVPDLLWFGGSASEGPRTLTHQAEALIGVLDAEGIDEVELMGVSYGGFVTMKIVQLQPARVRRMIIVDSPGGVFSDEDITAMARRFGGETAADVFVPTGPDGARTLIDLCFYDPPWLPGFVYDDIYEQVFSRNHEQLAELLDDLPRQRDDFYDFDWAGAPERLLIWGEFDRVFPVSEARELAEVSGAELVVIERTAHGPNFEEPERFNEVVLGFLAR
ncbi:MAG: alpha/beta hydrolase [Alphaproteobacteria bacterium]|nr:alpha/beta hydrolase [Alphaproteobacteria bacterium]